MPALVTGYTGQLGHDVVDVLRSRGIDELHPTRREMDFSDGESVRDYFRKNRPTSVIHCGAWTKVDLAEDKPGECRRANVDGTRNLADECEAADIPMLLVSTDYVFNGKGDRPWRIDDPVDPINVYGRSKADAEEIVRHLPKHYIVRTSWVYGNMGPNFVLTMIRLSKGDSPVRVVDDQIGSPTYTMDLAPVLVDIAESGKFGIYHACNEDTCSWYEFARKIFEMTGSKTDVFPVSTAEYMTKAKRPANSRLDTSELAINGFSRLPTWEAGLSRYMEKITRD